MRVTHWLIIGVSVVAAYFAFQHFQSGSAEKTRREMTNNVTFTVAYTGSIDRYIDALGTVTPQNTVVIQSRVDGQITALHFKEGQMVKEGELLAEIDDRPFQAQLKQAEGQKLRNEAVLQEARQTLERYTSLFAKDSIPRQQLDTQVSLVKQYEGAVKNDQGLVENAQIQLDYTRITAPVSGRIGLRKVDIGNIVKAAGTQSIATITEVSPISVVFSIPEDRIPDVTKAFATGTSLTVEAWNRESTVKIATGTLEALDNQVDTQTGTLKLRARFENNDNALFPNQFVNIRLSLGRQENVVIIPTSSLQRGSLGTFVYRIKDDETVEAVPITISITENDLMSIASGIAAGDKIVSEGGSSLKNGAKVKATERKQGAIESVPKAPPQPASTP